MGCSVPDYHTSVIVLWIVDGANCVSCELLSSIASFMRFGSFAASGLRVRHKSRQPVATEAALSQLQPDGWVKLSIHLAVWTRLCMWLEWKPTAASDGTHVHKNMKAQFRETRAE